MAYRYSVISSFIPDDKGQSSETFGLKVCGLPCGAMLIYEDLSFNKNKVEALCSRLQGEELDITQLSYIIEDFTDL